MTHLAERVTPFTGRVTLGAARTTIFVPRVTLFGRRVTLRVTPSSDTHAMYEVLP